MTMKRTAENRHITTVDARALIRNVLDGKTEQFRTLADRHGECVQKFVARMVPLPEDAEELTWEDPEG